MSKTLTLDEEIAQLTWWHPIVINGKAVPAVGGTAHVEWMGGLLPSSFQGLRVLDIGAFDGYFSFLAEERGATRVLAIDNFQNPQAHKDTLAAFELAKRAKASKVEYRLLDVLDVEKVDEKFDAVLFLGVYYHLPDPLAALQRIRAVLAPGGRVFFEGLVRHGKDPVLYYYRPGEIEETTFCAATVAGMERISHLAGFSQVRRLGVTRGSRFGSWVYAHLSPSLRRRLVARARSGQARSPLPRALLELKV
jgi:tRNA (mo5U34)-methyltransferase